MVAGQKPIWFIGQDLFKSNILQNVLALFELTRYFSLKTGFSHDSVNSVSLFILSVSSVAKHKRVVREYLIKISV